VTKKKDPTEKEEHEGQKQDNIESDRHDQPTNRKRGESQQEEEKM